MKNITIYKKKMTVCITDDIPIENIEFKEYEFKKVKTEGRLPIEEYEMVGVYDPNIYKKN